MKPSLALAAFLFLVTPDASAQQTWVVNFLGGPGVDFPDLSSAVTAAASGDTILVQSSLGFGAGSFTTSKGLTIVGDGGGIPVYGLAVVSGLPASETFTMTGFAKKENGPLNFEIWDCSGSVLLDNICAREPDFFEPQVPSIEISNSHNVTLREVGTWGYPAVQVISSTVLFTQCQLGRSKIGLGGGVAIAGGGSTIRVVEPRFHTGMGAAAAIDLINGELTISGSSLSYINNVGGGSIAFLGGGGTTTIDPAVLLTPGPGAALFLGGGPVVTKTISATWSDHVMGGQPLTISTSAPPSALVFQAIGVPAKLASTSFGLLGLDLGQPYLFLPGTVSPAGGVTHTTLPVPATVIAGTAFATQAMVIAGGAIELGLPCYLAAQ